LANINWPAPRQLIEYVPICLCLEVYKKEREGKAQRAQENVYTVASVDNVTMMPSDLANLSTYLFD